LYGWCCYESEVRISIISLTASGCCSIFVMRNWRSSTVLSMPSLSASSSIILTSSWFWLACCSICCWIGGL